MNIRMEVLAEIPLHHGEKIVSMCQFQGCILACTDHGTLYRIDEDMHVAKINPVPPG